MHAKTYSGTHLFGLFSHLLDWTRQVDFNMTDFDLDDRPAAANSINADNDAQKVIPKRMSIAKRISIANVTVGGSVNVAGLNVTLP